MTQCPSIACCDGFTLQGQVQWAQRIIEHVDIILLRTIVLNHTRSYWLCIVPLVCVLLFSSIIAHNASKIGGASCVVCFGQVQYISTSILWWWVMVHIFYVGYPTRCASLRISYHRAGNCQRYVWHSSVAGSILLCSRLVRRQLQAQWRCHFIYVLSTSTQEIGILPHDCLFYYIVLPFTHN